MIEWMTGILANILNGDLDLTLIAWAVLFVFMTSEEMGLPAPLVSSTIVLALGYDAGTGGQSPLGAFLAVQAIVIGSSIVGASVIYAIGRLGARPVVDRIADRLGAGGRVTRLSEWFQKRGAIVVLLARLTPGLLTLTSLVAGALRIPYGLFCLYVTVTATAWAAVFYIAGLVGGMAAGASGVAPMEGAVKLLPVIAASLLLATLPLLIRRIRWSRAR